MPYCRDGNKIVELNRDKLLSLYGSSVESYTPMKYAAGPKPKDKESGGLILNIFIILGGLLSFLLLMLILTNKKRSR